MSENDPHTPPLAADPYKPPLAANGPTPTQLTGPRYSGFWQRVGAYLIDFLIVSPLIGIDYLYGGSTRLFQLYMLLPAQLIAAYMYIYMVVRYGGTPGKLLLGLRIVKLNGDPVTVKEALLRYVVIWAMALILSVILISGALSISSETFSSYTYMERSAALSAAAPVMMKVSMLMQMWVLACIVAILATKERRALHDFIAGTVVVRKR